MDQFQTFIRLEEITIFYLMILTFFFGILEQGYFIPKGAWVLLHFYAMSRQESHWKDAHVFRPERFLNEEGKFQKNDNFLVFSTGNFIFLC